MKPIMKGTYWLAAMLAAGVTAQAQAQDANTARNLASTCFTCHGTDGRSVDGVPPALAGRKKRELLQAMMDFKEGRRPGTIMHQQAKGYTNEQIDLITGYFAGVKPGAASPAPAAR